MTGKENLPEFQANWTSATHPMSQKRTPPDPDEISHAVAHLRSVRLCDRGALEAIALGPAMIAPLRQALFEREPSGLYECRFAMIDALAALRAERELTDFLAFPHLAEDPVEQAGTETAMSYAARALLASNDQRLPHLMLELAQKLLLPGAIEWLGHHRSIEAIPIFIVALGDDIARDDAMVALERMGGAAVPALQGAVQHADPDLRAETETSRRRRKSAAFVLWDMTKPDK